MISAVYLKEKTGVQFSHHFRISLFYLTFLVFIFKNSLSLVQCDCSDPENGQ